MGSSDGAVDPTAPASDSTTTPDPAAGTTGSGTTGPVVGASLGGGHVVKPDPYSEPH